jgi:hypothetical protein
VADALPRGEGALVLEAARGAFVQGLQITAVIGMIGFVALAIVVGTSLRHIEPHFETVEDEPVALPGAVEAGD